MFFFVSRNREVGGHRIIGSAPSIRAKRRITGQDFGATKERRTAINPCSNTNLKIEIVTHNYLQEVGGPLLRPPIFLVITSSTASKKG